MSKLVTLTLFFFVLFAGHSAFDSEADFGYSARVNLPAQCTYSAHNWKRRVHCENEFPDFDSTNRTFLESINELVIDHCAFMDIAPESFKHLPNLKYVTIDCDAISVQVDAFDDLVQLTEVSVRKNAVAFPDELFCFFDSLHSLNVSNNEIVSDVAMGLSNCSDNNPSPSCGGTIKTLNAANNGLTSINKDGFLCNLKALQRLNLAGNAIGTIEKEAFARVPMLDRLNLGGNLITELSVDAFKFASGVTHLDLSDNRFTDLPMGIFQSMPRLSHLNISGNLLTALNNGLFGSMVNLRTLDLSNNFVIDINNAFQNLKNLSRLDLSGNSLQAIDADTIDGLQSVSALNLSNNEIRTISVDIFDSCPQLLFLNLSYNRLKEVPTLRAEQLVYGLYFDYNEIEELNAVDCDFKEGLVILSFTFNRLTTIGPKALAPFRSLLYLDLSNNDIESLDDLAFDGLSSLYTLKLNGNLLSLQNNGINPFVSLNKLEYLDLSDNNISEIAHSQFPSNVVDVKLNNNNIRSVHPEAFTNLAELKSLNLQNNSLTTLPTLQLPNNSTAISLQGNPLSCDCSIGWLNNWRMGMFSVFNTQLIKCRVFFKPKPTSAPRIITFLGRLKLDFLCSNSEEKTNQSADCSSWICTQRQLCPDNCVCYHNFQWTVVKMVCANTSDLLEIPKVVPMATDVAIFYNVSMTSIDVNAFETYTNVSQLIVRHTGLNHIHENGLEPLINLERIGLDHNELTALDQSIFKGLFRLRFINLSNNKLKSIGLNIFDDLENLEGLNIANNRLTNFPVWSIDSLSTVSSMVLIGNPWSCNCTFVIPFHDFLIYHARSILNVSQLYCKREPLSDELIPLHTFNVSHCILFNNNSVINSISSFSAMERNENVVQGPNVAAIVFGSLFCATFIVLGIFVYIFRVEIKIAMARKVSKLLIKNKKQTIERDN